MHEGWLDEYNKLNNSYKKTLVFRLGVDAGFFSEFNNMIVAMLYCLKHKIKFTLSSSNSHLSINKGWEDFFLPFCPQNTASFHFKFNLRPQPAKAIKKSFKGRFMLYCFRMLNRKYYLTQDLWPSFYNKEFINKKIVVKELGIDHQLLEAANILIQNIWRFQPEIKVEIEKRINNLGLPQKYAGMHLRSGDKIKEHKLYSADEYINKLKQVSSFNEVFVATDDYKNIETLNSNYPEFNFYSLCRPSSFGHLQREFNKQKKDSKKDLLIELFSDITILQNGAQFIGTYSSNIGMFLAATKGESKCYCVDYDSWNRYMN